MVFNEADVGLNVFVLARVGLNVLVTIVGLLVLGEGVGFRVSECFNDQALPSVTQIIKCVLL